MGMAHDRLVKIKLQKVYHKRAMCELRTRFIDFSVNKQSSSSSIDVIARGIYLKCLSILKSVLWYLPKAARCHAPLVANALKRRE
jgi:hypothetical protein